MRIPDAAEALLAYLYTGDAGDKIDVVALLPLAHRFEVPNVVEYCASQLAQEVGEQNISTIVSALQPFVDDPNVKPHWDAVVRKVQNDDELVQKVLLTCTFLSREG